jgi:GTPase SAR1 family protein
MPVPLIPIAAAGGVTILGWLLSRYRKKFSNGINFGILGIAGSGKTTLAHYLAHEEFLEEPEPSTETKTYKDKKVEALGGITVHITDVRTRGYKKSCNAIMERDSNIDSESYYSHVHEDDVIRKNEIVLYLFNMSELFKPTKDDYYKRMKGELIHYSKALKTKHKLILIGTFNDKIENAVSVEKVEITRKLEELCTNFKCKYKELYWSSLVNENETRKTVNNIDRCLNELIGGRK